VEGFYLPVTDFEEFDGTGMGRIDREEQFAKDWHQIIDPDSLIPSGE
jgi:hypothetical protein